MVSRQTKIMFPLCQASMCLSMIVIIMMIIIIIISSIIRIRIVIITTVPERIHASPHVTDHNCDHHHENHDDHDVYHHDDLCHLQYHHCHCSHHHQESVIITIIPERIHMQSSALSTVINLPQTFQVLLARFVIILIPS